MKRLFGTDGIRAVAGTYPLDPPTVRRFGRALAEVLQASLGRPPRVLLGRDTRESGGWLRDAVSDGLAFRHAVVVDAGIITTPGLAFLVRRGFDAGVMISASHNPFADNGLKVFGADGMKLSDALEAEVEARILDGSAPEPPRGSVTVREEAALREAYVEFLERVLGSRERLRGWRIALDCANGCAAGIAPRVFRSYGADVVTIGDDPDGRNINLGCGSLHLEPLARQVRERGCDCGLAFDGDADRVLLVDRRGRTVDGDHVLYLSACRLKREGRLRGDRVVATIMSNLWLERELAREGIALSRAPVGDKYVLERMLAEDAVLGGEPSGHVIFREWATTGDGILTGLLFLDTLRDQAESLESVLDRIRPCPQVQRNVRVRAKPDLRAHPAIGPALRESERVLDGIGRIVVRYSGTEPVARIMVEGTDEQLVHEHAQRLATLIETELGDRAGS